MVLLYLCCASFTSRFCRRVGTWGRARRRSAILGAVGASCFSGWARKEAPVAGSGPLVVGGFVRNCYGRLQVQAGASWVGPGSWRDNRGGFLGLVARRHYNFPPRRRRAGGEVIRIRKVRRTGDGWPATARFARAVTASAAAGGALAARAAATRWSRFFRWGNSDIPGFAWCDNRMGAAEGLEVRVGLACENCDKEKWGGVAIGWRGGGGGGGVAWRGGRVTERCRGVVTGDGGRWGGPRSGAPRLRRAAAIGSGGERASGAR
jgi:hypothetical protein